MSGERLTVEEAIEELDSIDMAGDPEGAHSAADLVLRCVVDERVAAAYDECVKRTGRWWFA